MYRLTSLTLLTSALMLYTAPVSAKDACSTASDFIEDPVANPEASTSAHVADFNSDGNADAIWLNPAGSEMIVQFFRPFVNS